MRKRNAFTVVELAIIIAIVSVLMTLSIIIFNHSQASSRDMQRKSDALGIMYAMQRYYEAHGDYPMSPQCQTAQDTGQACPLDSLTSVLVPQYLEAIPHDPAVRAAHTSYLYFVNPSDPSQYAILLTNETYANCKTGRIRNINFAWPDVPVCSL